MTGRARAMWFGPAERPLFGWLHTPAGDRARGGVVLCHPLGRERTSAHLTFRLLAESLAERGLVAVRFDYDGTGDSAGDDLDPDRLGAWTAGVVHAAELLRGCGVEDVALVGMRMGALLALAATDRCHPLSAMVLWDPCPSGRAFLREKRALQMLHFGGDPLEDGVVEVPGEILSADTAEELRRFRPAPPGRPPRRTLVLSRPPGGAAADPDLGDALAGSEVECGDADGQPELLDVEPLHHRVPTGAVRRIAAWLDRSMESPARPVAAAPVGAGAAPVRGRIELAGPAGSTIVERTVSLGPLGLFGVETAPAGGGHGPAVVFLNGGTDWHAGSNRLWVRLARRWAANGLRSVRVDLSGLGDSPARAAQARNVVRAPEAFDDVREVMAAVSPDDPADVVLVGLCSGAYQVLEAALCGPVRGVCAVNPLLRFAPPEMADGPMDPRRRICRPATPALRAYRKLPLPRLRRAVRPLVWWLGNLRPGPTAPARWLVDLAGNADTFCICGEDEARPLLQGTGRARRRLSARGRLRIDVVAGLDHGLLPWRQRRDVAERLTEHVLARFGPSERSPDAGAAGAAGATATPAVATPAVATPLVGTPAAATEEGLPACTAG